jgi:hypothetical protein
MTSAPHFNQAKQSLPMLKVLLAQELFFALSCWRTVFKYALALATHRENNSCTQVRKSCQLINLEYDFDVQ